MDHNYEFDPNVSEIDKVPEVPKSMMEPPAATPPAVAVEGGAQGMVLPSRVIPNSNITNADIVSLLLKQSEDMANMSRSVLSMQKVIFPDQFQIPNNQFPQVPQFQPHTNQVVPRFQVANPHPHQGSIAHVAESTSTRAAPIALEAGMDPPGGSGSKPANDDEVSLSSVTSASAQWDRAMDAHVAGPDLEVLDPQTSFWEDDKLDYDPPKHPEVLSCTRPQLRLQPHSGRAKWMLINCRPNSLLA